jgi:hypothetical protein
MKAFKQGAELRLKKDDLRELLTDALNEKLFRMGMEKHEVIDISLHPSNAYVIRLELKPTSNA